MRILLVEDERKVASFIARALRENSYAVDVAETGEKALELATDVTYDAILLDVRLPGMSGVQVCRELRQLGTEAPVLMLTALGLVEQRGSRHWHFRQSFGVYLRALLSSGAARKR